MNVSTRTTWLSALAFACAVQHAHAQASFAVAGKQVTVQAAAPCEPRARPSRQLARYLRQYDPSGDPRSDSSDETAWTSQDKRLIREGLVEHGLRYPNGQESVLMWMDFDGDGACDFTASAGIGGMRSTERMFLFRGLPQGAFKLSHAYHTYMEGSMIVVPYIALDVQGEKSPVLASKDTLLQWRPALERLATCESIQHGPQARRHRRAAPALAALCPKARDIYDWAAGQMPHQNEMAQQVSD